MPEKNNEINKETVEKTTTKKTTSRKTTPKKDNKDKIIEEQKKDIQELKDQMANLMQILQNNNQPKEDPKPQVRDEYDIIPPNKKIKVMHMVNSGAHFNRGRFRFGFEKIFDTHTFKWDNLQDVVNEFSEWFKTKQLVIVGCPEAVDELGLAHEYEKFPTFKEDYVAILEIKDPTDFINKVKDINPEIRPYFVNFYIEQYLDGNQSTMNPKKIRELSNYFGVNINNVIAEFDEY